MPSTLIRIFFDDDQVLGVVDPTCDEELDQHHKALVVAPHKYVDMSRDDYMKHVMVNGLPHIPSLHPIVKVHPNAKDAIK